MSDKLQITGIIKQIGETASFGAKGFLKREFIVETTGDKYPQPLKFECVQDNCEKLNKHHEGQAVTVHFNLRGNEHNGRYYVSLVAWRLEANGTQAEPQSAPQQRQTPMDQQPADSEYPF